MQIGLMVVLVCAGVFIVYVRPFPGALWVGILLALAGFYWAWRFGKNLRKRNQEMSDYERER